MSASLIGHLGASAFRPSTTNTVSMSLTGSCFSSESAPRPFHHGIRRRGGTIFWSALPSDERQIQADIANSPHPSSRPPPPPSPRSIHWATSAAQPGWLAQGQYRQLRGRIICDGRLRADLGDRDSHCGSSAAQAGRAHGSRRGGGVTSCADEGDRVSGPRLELRADHSSHGSGLVVGL
jgi:hypothetical protein